jgi:hypothetical protein
MVSVRVLPIEAYSDHASILINIGIPRPSCKHPYKFKLGWLRREGFSDLVKTVWEKPIAGTNPIQIWNNKLHAMHIYHGGWASHMTGLLKNEKFRMSFVINDIEAITEVRIIPRSRNNI